MENESKKIPTIFISYSWAVKEKVIELVHRLWDNGVNVIIDIYDLKAGQDKYYFMEQSVNNPQVDNVLIICDKTYAEKANSRTGGVGDETVIITPELYGALQQTKFLPVIFEKDENEKAYCPTYIKSLIYYDLSSSDSKHYEAEFEKLLRHIYKKPLYSKPALGKRPEFLDEQTESNAFSAIKNVLKQIEGCASNKRKQQILFTEINDLFLAEAKKMTLSGIDTFENEFSSIYEPTLEFRNLYLKLWKEVIMTDFPFVNIFVSFIEVLYNGLYKAPQKDLPHNKDIADFILQECFITTTALLLHYKEYHSIHDLLSQKYFSSADASFEKKAPPIKHTFLSELVEIAEAFVQVWTLPNQSKFAGKTIVDRAPPRDYNFFSKEEIINADLILHQLGYVLSPDEYLRHWTPTTKLDWFFVRQDMWKRMTSRKYCETIFPLFGITSIEQLKDFVSREKERFTYLGAPPRICSSISVDRIGSE